MKAEVYPMPIGTRIRDARIANQWTQSELAKRVGVTTSAIGNYESGVSSPKEHILIALMKTLGVDANYLYQDAMTPATVVSFGPNDEDPARVVTTEDEYELLKAYRGAEEAARRYALDLLRTHPAER